MAAINISINHRAYEVNVDLQGIGHALYAELVIVKSKLSA